jgi:DNA polymerase III subunit gamma/tau
MLSTPAFNALLKILEEPPEHLIFILATTEIYKVPATILSRCQRFTFKRILPEKISERLLYIAGQEGLTLAKDASHLLARLSDGSLRDAVSLLDQCASTDVIDYSHVMSAIGLAENDEIVTILTAVAEHDISGALAVLDKLYKSGKVMASVIEALMNLIRDILVTSLMPDGGSGLLSGGFERDVLEDFKKKLTNPQLLNIMTVLRETMLDFSKSSGGKLSAELCLIRLCDRQPSGDLSSILDRISALEENARSGYAPPRKEQPAAIEKSAQPVQQPAESPKGDIGTVQEISKQTQDAHATSSHATSSQGEAAVTHSGDVWHDILKMIQAKIDIPPFMFLSDPAQTSAFIEGNMLTVRVKNDFPAKIINVPPVTSAIQEAAGAILNSPAVVRVVMEDGGKNGSIDKLESALKRFPGVLQVED